MSPHFAVFLYGSIAMELLIFLLRIDELAEVAFNEEIFELETCLLSVTVLCLLTLAVLDGYTIYKEVSPTNMPNALKNAYPLTTRTQTFCETTEML